MIRVSIGSVGLGSLETVARELRREIPALVSEGDN